jgi:dTDP-4-dehydrorhamnose 3,5-epimerase
MKFTDTAIPGSFVIDLEPHRDDRGFFARTFCAETFAKHGLKSIIAQSNVTFNHRKGTIRGLHYQLPPMAEAKLLRCTRGAIYEVIVDMRPDSPAFMQHLGVELTEFNRRLLYVPEMCAAGYQALADESEAAYSVCQFYAPEQERGFRYDDPAFGVDWPLKVTKLSEKDRNWPSFDAVRHREEVYDSCR